MLLFGDCMFFYQRIRDLREDADLNQTQVGEILGINQRMYSNYETGKRQFPAHLLIKLAVFYETSVDYLLGLTDDRKPYPRKRK